MSPLPISSILTNGDEYTLEWLSRQNFPKHMAQPIRIRRHHFTSVTCVVYRSYYLLERPQFLGSHPFTEQHYIDTFSLVYETGGVLDIY
jgi:hypothetical protein